jgi:hypothetical protein
VTRVPRRVRAEFHAGCDQGLRAGCYVGSCARHGRAAGCGRQSRTPPAHRPGEHQHLALGEVAERPRGGRLERGDTGRVLLAHQTGRVDLVAEHHHVAHAAQPGAGRGHERGQDIGGPVRPGQARVTHRPGDHDRRVRGVHQVQQESRLLDRVGALDHHRARRPRGNLTRDRPGQIQHVLDGERGTRQASEVVNCYLGTDPAQTGHRGEQVRRGERGHSRYRFAPAANPPHPDALLGPPHPHAPLGPSRVRARQGPPPRPPAPSRSCRPG